jgi:hypothetical protein
MLVLAQSLPGEGRGLVDKDQAPWVKPALVLLPADAPVGDVGAVLLAGVQVFLNVIPSCLKKRVRHSCRAKKCQPHRIAEDPTSVMQVQWTDCGIDDAVRLYRVNGSGYRVPSLAVGPEDDWEKKAGENEKKRP